MRIRELVVGLAITAGCSHKAPQAEVAAPAAPASAVSAKVPPGQLTQVSGEKIALADVLHQHAETVVVFYRGFY